MGGQIFLVTLKQVVVCVFYIFIGYFLCKKKLLKKESSGVLSKLLVYCFQPAYTISNLIKNVSVNNVKEYFLLIISGAVAMGIGLIFATLVSKLFSKEKFTRRIISYVLAFSNIGYFGYPLISAVFGEQMLTLFIIFCLPLSIGIQTYGYYILTEKPDSLVSEENLLSEKEKRKDVLKRIFSVPAIAIVLGIIIGLLPFEKPQIVFDILKPAGNCMSATAMILMGIVLANVSFKEIVLSAKPYLISFCRLLVVPALFGSICYLLKITVGLDDNILICAVAFSCLPAGMNVVVFPESVGIDAREGTKACFLAYVFAVATIPFWFYILSIL